MKIYTIILVFLTLIPLSFLECFVFSEAIGVILNVLYFIIFNIFFVIGAIFLILTEKS